MSNSLVGSVYSTIIDEVISSSRVDFEESGVDEAALEILRKVGLFILHLPCFACPAKGRSMSARTLACPYKNPAIPSGVCVHIESPYAPCPLLPAFPIQVYYFNEHAPPCRATVEK